MDNTRAYEYVTASTIRDAYLKHPIALDMENELAAPYRPEPGALDLPTYKCAGGGGGVVRLGLGETGGLLARLAEGLLPHLAPGATPW